MIKNMLNMTTGTITIKVSILDISGYWLVSTIYIKHGKVKSLIYIIDLTRYKECVICGTVEE